MMPAGRGRETIITDDYVTDDESNEKGSALCVNWIPDMWT